MRIRREEHMAGGNGHVIIKEILDAEQLNGKCGLYAQVTLEPGCSLGYHEHHGESETYYILQGQGEYNDNGTYRPVKAGDITFTPENLAKLIELADAGTINSSVAKEVFDHVFEENVDPEKYVEEHGLKTVNDEGALIEVLEKVIADNPQAVVDYKGGKEKALGALVGQTMKAMKGKANPGLVNQKLREMLK